MIFNLCHIYLFIDLRDFNHRFKLIIILHNIFNLIITDETKFVPASFRVYKHVVQQ